MQAQMHMEYCVAVALIAELDTRENVQSLIEMLH